ncbi:MAG TPA: potassium-transporting ATPase subunit C [Pirellulales bacterium]|nr:potassium-transporting ATPase subunit C [Pirellulales bacterium]
MLKIISKSLWLLLLSVIICCVIYPAIMWAIGQAFFPFQANGSLLKSDGTPTTKASEAVGSLLIAQPFTKDEFFQPRPSACSYDASASSSSALAASNYTLRNRVATAIGPLATYKSGANTGKPVGPDIEAWFKDDKFQGNPSIVAQWADTHNGVAQAWVGTTFDEKNPTPQQQYVLDWEKTHADIVTKFKADNPDNQSPSPSDLAVVFFDNFSKENPGKFLSAVTKTGADGNSTTSMQLVTDGSDIQSTFFDLWRQDHADADLQDVPGDMVTTSGSGLDPHITLDNALFQLDRVAAAWAKDSGNDEAKLHKEIESLLKSKSTAPLDGMAGEPIVNVLEMNLALQARYQKQTPEGK